MKYKIIILIEYLSLTVIIIKLQIFKTVMFYVINCIIQISKLKLKKTLLTLH